MGGRPEGACKFDFNRQTPTEQGRPEIAVPAPPKKHRSVVVPHVRPCVVVPLVPPAGVLKRPRPRRHPPTLKKKKISSTTLLAWEWEPATPPCLPVRFGTATVAWLQLMDAAAQRGIILPLARAACIQARCRSTLLVDVPYTYSCHPDSLAGCTTALFFECCCCGAASGSSGPHFAALLLHSVVPVHLRREEVGEAHTHCPSACVATCPGRSFAGVCGPPDRTYLTADSGWPVAHLLCLRHTCALRWPGVRRLTAVPLPPLVVGRSEDLPTSERRQESDGARLLRRFLRSHRPCRMRYPGGVLPLGRCGGTGGVGGRRGRWEHKSCHDSFGPWRRDRPVLCCALHAAHVT